MHEFIIEDDYLIGQGLQDMLTPLGFTRFSFARSEDAAILGAHGEAFDLIAADVRLLPGDGVRAVEAICRKRRMPVVFVTGYPEEVEGRIEQAVPGATVVRKPVDQENLAIAVRKAIAARKAE